MTIQSTYLKKLTIGLYLFFLLLLPTLSKAQNGTSMYDAIPAGTYSSCTGNYFDDSRSNDPSNWPYYTNNIGYDSPDVWYTVTLENLTDMDFSLCGNYDFDTYMRLLDSNGNEIAANDDDCDNAQAHLVYPQLPAGTYYLVVEGYDTYTGDFNLSITQQTSPTVGSYLSNAIIAGTFTGAGSYTHSMSNADPCLSNDIGQDNPDIYYQFSLSSTAIVKLSHCGSSIDTYMWLLDVNGNVIRSNNDNNNSPCPGNRAYIQTTLAAGTYYVVSEGNGLNVGDISTSINIFPVLPFNPSQDQNYIISSTPLIAFNTEEDLLDNRWNQNDVQSTIQYYDGLGRPIQMVQLRASGGGSKDVVVPNQYDAYGREAKKYLPYASTNNNDGSYKVSALTDAISYYNGSQPAPGLSTSFATPYSESIFDNSPQNNILEQGAPGSSWQPVPSSTAGHTVKMVYGVNATGEVRLWNLIINGADATNSFYQANHLHKTTTKDENWISGKAGTTEEFKDKGNRVVLKRVWKTESVSLSTYYVYDDLGNLRYVLPPAVNENSDRVTSINSFIEADDVFKQFIYGYHYDNRNRMVEKKIPGKDWEYIVYNSLDQVILSQDWALRNEGKWLFTKYDAFGNVIISGLYNDGGSRQAIQNTVNGLVISNPNYKWWEEASNSGVGYTNGVFPQSINYYHSINYYGNYSFPGNVFGLPNTGVGQLAESRTTGLLTASSVTVLGTSSMLLTVNYYDPEGRVIQSKSQHYKHNSADQYNYDEVSNVYSFTDQITESTRKHYNNGTESLYVYNGYTYDHMGRKVSTKQRTGVNSGTGNPLVTLSAIDYNEIGQLVTKHQGSEAGSPFLQNTQYSYNERGWLKMSNSGLFTMELKYNDGTVPQFNGNISQQIYTNGLANTFSYGYDKLNRLETSVAGNNLGEVISYDVMGNIKTLSRDGYGTNDYNISLYSGNQLKQISGFTNGSYTYYQNGNLEVDGPNGNTISYNYLNLPTQVTGSQNVIYIYDATGRKLRKQSAVAGTTDYVDGIHYKTDGTIDFIQTEDGIARNNSGNYSYEYNQKDHLGNVRLSFYKNPSSGLLEVLQRDDYYAFGQRKAVGFLGLNKYLYNGKELQQELGTANIGQYDYGARFYDPVIGRWTVVDPFAEKFDFVSPYNYVVNNPTNVIDPDGMESITLTGEDAQEWVRNQHSRKQIGGPGDGKKNNNNGYFPSLYDQFVELDPFVNGEIGKTWSNWLSSESTLVSDVWSGVSNTLWGVASLTNANTYVNWYQGQKEYWSSSAEDRGKADAVYLASFVGETAKYGPLGQTKFLSSLASLKSGYGLKLGNVELFYALPRAEGITIFSYQNSAGKAFRLDYHKVPIKTMDGVRSKTPRTLHYHTNFFSQGVSQHRSLNPWTFGKPIK